MRNFTAWRENNFQNVSQERKPDANCKYCGKPIYFIRLCTKKRGEHWGAFEDRGHGGAGIKVLQRHRCK